MTLSFKKLWAEYGIIGVIILLLIIAYAVNLFANYLTKKGSAGSERMSGGPNPAYKNKSNNMGVQPANPAGQNEVYASVNGLQTSTPGIPSSCSKPNVQNPAELLPLPKDDNGQWAQLNPSGKGDLANINLLKAGYHIGIDTIGQTLRNANLQIRSEPANPQLYVGPWNQSTIEPDFMRPPLEIGAGNQ